MTTPDTMTDPHVEAALNAVRCFEVARWGEQDWAILEVRDGEPHIVAHFPYETQADAACDQLKTDAAIAAYRKSLADAGFVIVSAEPNATLTGAGDGPWPLPKATK